jgi:hypothetical protein
MKLASAGFLLALLTLFTGPEAHAASSLLSLKRPATASSVEGGNTADLAGPASGAWIRSGCPWTWAPRPPSTG